MCFFFFVHKNFLDLENFSILFFFFRKCQETALQGQKRPETPPQGQREEQRVRFCLENPYVKKTKNVKKLPCRVRNVKKLPRRASAKNRGLGSIQKTLMSNKRLSFFSFCAKKIVICQRRNGHAESYLRLIVSAPNSLSAEQSLRRTISAPNHLSTVSAAPKIRMPERQI